MCWTMANPFNMLGRLPVISVPSGFASNKVPTGIQIISRSYSDNLVFQAAYNYENIDPWLQNPEKQPKIEFSYIYSIKFAMIHIDGSK